MQRAKLFKVKKNVGENPHNLRVEKEFFFPLSKYFTVFSAFSYFTTP